MNKTLHDPKIGGHLSSTQGLRFVVLEARALGYGCLQTMLGQNTDYAPREITDGDAMEFRKMTFGLATYVHMPFILNPCEGAPQRRAFYRRSFRLYMRAAAAIGARSVVIHPGFRKEQDPETAMQNLVKFFEEGVEEDLPTSILMETDSGSKNGSAIGTLAFIAEAIKRLDSDRYGICLDTAHLYARGTNIWDEPTRAQTLQTYGRDIRLIHLNSPDPEVTLGSFLDRHNTPLKLRTELDHEGMVKDLAARYPMILERSSLAVQEQDADHIREILAQPKETEEVVE